MGATLEVYMQWSKTIKLVQIKNPKTKEWVLIDKTKGLIVNKREKRYKNVLVVPHWAFLTGKEQDND